MFPYLIAGAIGYAVAKLLEEDEAPKYADGGLIAPNGKPSNLTPEQYKLVRTPEFKAWFGDWENDPANSSKVIDFNGEPLVVYHGTKKEFNIFDKEKINSNYTQSIGFHFNYDEESVKISYASPNSISKEIGFVKSVFLNIKNPLIIKSDFGSSDSAEEYIDLNRIKLKEKIINSKKTNNILDGIISSGYSYTKSFVAFEPNQIKLADGTNTTFDNNNPDIRYAGGGSVSLKKLLDFKLDEVQIDNEYAHANLGIEQLSDGEVSIYISEIWSDIKGEGYATKLLNKLKKFSNKSGVPLSLRASVSNNIQTSGGLNQQELVDWYIKNGFKISEKDNNFETDSTAPFMVYNR